jgi:transposase
MREDDGRQLSSEAQEQRRRLAVDMKQDGATLAEICEAVGMNPTTVCRAWASFKAGGYEGLKGNRRGRREGEKRTLSEADERKIRKKIVDRLPAQLKLDFALWTRDAVRQLISQETGIEMPVRTVGEYLKRWGFTPQKPIKFAYERKPEAVRKWLDVDYPQIRERAKHEKTEIYWGDETGLRSNDVRGRGFAPRARRQSSTFPQSTRT